jgi:TonB family protein
LDSSTPEPTLVLLAVTVSPPDSTVLVDGEKFALRDESGRRIANLKPGKYSVTASKPGYAEYAQSIVLTSKTSESLNIILRPQPGSVNINSNVENCEIVITNKDRDRFIGRYSGSVNALSVEPGQYEITITKSGYRTTKRTVNVKSGDSIYLEPVLEPEESGASMQTPSQETPSAPDAVMPVRQVPAITEDAVSIKTKLPVYPPAALKTRVTGIVVVYIKIDEQGRVTSAKALEGPFILRYPAEEAALHYKFRPALSNGRPVSSSQTLRFNFKLTN